MSPGDRPPWGIPGDVLGGRFRLSALRSSSASGWLWDAEDTEAGDDCVVKVLATPGGAEAAWPGVRSEVELLRASSHPHLARFRDVVFEPERQVLAIAMDRVQGEELATVAGRGGLPEADVLAILGCTARGLAALHARGILHRDLQPRNVMVTGEPGCRGAVLIDLGLAVPLGRRLAKEVTGTLGFVAPEVLLEGAPDERADIYSLGCLLQFMLTGSPPLEPEALLGDLARGEDPFPAVEARAREILPAPFGALVARLLARRPSSRFPSATDLLAELNSRFQTRFQVDSVEDRRLAIASAAFVVRRTERRSLLGRVLGALRGGSPAAEILVGARGVGRTRLLQEVLRVVQYGGHPVVHIRPSPSSVGPFSSLLPALARVRHRFPRESRAALAEAERILGSPGSLLPENRYPAAGALLVEALRSAAAAPGGLLAAADDVDRMEPGTLQVLAGSLPLGEEEKGLRALVLTMPEGASERTPSAALRGLLHRVRSSSAVRETRLRPLSSAGTERLLRALLPLQDLPRHLLERVHEVSGGIPAGVVEMAGALLASERIVYRAEGWVLLRPGSPLPLPATTAQCVEQRLAALPSASAAALRMLALAGGSVSRPAWAGILAASRAGSAAEDALRSGGFLRPEEGTEEVGLGSEALLAGLLAGGGREDLPGDRETLIRILREAGESSSPVTVRLLLDASRDEEALAVAPAALAGLRCAHRMGEAEELAGAVLACARRNSAAPGRAAVFEEAAALRYLQRRPGPARELAREGLAGAASGRERLALLLRLREIDALEGRIPEEEEDREFRSLAPSEAECARAELSRAMAESMADRWRDSRRTLESLLPRLEESPALRMRALNGLAGLDAREGRLVEAEAGYRAALGIARELRDPGAEGVTLRNLATLEIRRGRFRFALRVAGEIPASYGGGFSPPEAALTHALRATALEGLGRWKAARRESMRSLLVAEEAEIPALHAAAARRLGTAEGKLGQPEAALRWLTLALRKAEEARSIAEARAAHLAVAGLHEERGDREAATEALRSVPGGEADEFRTRVLRVLLAPAPEDPAGALAETRRLLALPQSTSWPEERTRMQIHEARLGLLTGDEDRAAGRLEEIAAACRREGRVDEHARALLALGTARANPGNGAGARRVHDRLARLGARLENVVLGAECLEAAGRFFLGDPGRAGQGRGLMEQAARLYEAASLASRAEGVRMAEGTRERTGWKGIPSEKLGWLLERTGELNSAANPEDVLESVLDAAVSLTGAERAFLVLASGDGFEVKASRSMGKEEIGHPGKSFSASLVQRILQTGRAITSSDALVDPRLSGFFSVQRLGLRSVLAVPIRRGRRILGAFYLDNRLLEGVFRDEDRRVLETLAEQAALAFENVSFRSEIRDLNRRLQERMAVQEKEIEGYRSTVRSIRRETKYAYEGIIRNGPAMGDVLRLVDQAVDSDVPVLLEGESGTGKELIARAIHFSGPLRGRPFVVVNCAALPETLIEAELFGHRKGAFTDARENRVGRLEAADGGTLLLDEIGEMPLGVQPKILRALQFGEFVPLGSSEPRKSRVRFLCATNRDLRGMMAAGAFREDLYYRIAVLPIRVPPLRERREDIPGMAEAILLRLAADAGRGPRRIDRRAMARLMEHSWPGNVRELENVLRRAALCSPGDVVLQEFLPIESPHSPRSIPVLDRIRAAVTGGLSPREEAAILRLLDRHRLTFRDYRRITGVAKSTAARDLGRLVIAKVLVRRGRTMAAFYTLDPRWKEETK